MRYILISLLFAGCAGQTIGQPSNYSHLPKDEFKQECNTDHRFCRQIGINPMQCQKELNVCTNKC